MHSALSNAIPVHFYNFKNCQLQRVDVRALEVETKTIWEDNCYTDPKVHNLVFGSLSHALRTKTSTSKVLISCSSQIFVNMVKKNIFELLAFLLETNLARAVTLT